MLQGGAAGHAGTRERLDRQHRLGGGGGRPARLPALRGQQGRGAVDLAGFVSGQTLVVYGGHIMY